MAVYVLGWGKHRNDPHTDTWRCENWGKNDNWYQQIQQSKTMDTFHSIKLIDLVLHFMWIFYSCMILLTPDIDYFRNIGSLSYADPLNVWHISLCSKKRTYFYFLLSILFVKYLSIWTLSSTQGLIKIFQNSNFLLKARRLSLKEKCCQLLSVKLQSLRSLLRKHESNTHVLLTAGCLFSFSK